MERLRLDRAEGWPNGLARILVGPGLLMAGLGPWAHGLYFYGGVTIVWALMLFAWRRGVTLDRRRQTLARWWGFGIPGHVWIVREVQSRSIEGYGQLRVAGAPEHYKQWRRHLFHYQLEKVDDTMGEVLPLRARIVVDDEFSTPEAAWQEAQRVAEFLDVPLARLTPALPISR
ncbi:MAG: hypothetical protein ACYCW6_02765 [Candidatus Xenobia bacterium]